MQKARLIMLLVILLTVGVDWGVAETPQENQSAEEKEDHGIPSGFDPGAHARAGHADFR